MKGMGPMAMAPPHGGHQTSGKSSAAAAEAGHASSMMHASLFWSDRAVVLFPGWPGERGAGAYVLCLLFVCALATLAEALAAVSRCVARRGGGGGRGGDVPASSAALLTAAHAARMGMAYLVMLAVMSFNVGVLLAAVAGHALGFLLARSRVHPAAATAAARGGCGVAAARDGPAADGSKA
ncbi:hypothetical protein EJB05_52756, partial [Eragrostis curvula]